jgi:hypothetical protein
MNASGKIQEMINESAQSMIKGLIRDAFEYNSPIRKKVKQAINDSLDVDLTQIDFTKHNTAMVHAVSESFKSEMLDNQVAKMKEKVTEIFGSPKKTEYTITEFVNEICSFIKNSHISDNYDEDTMVKVTVKDGICGWDFDLQIGECHDRDSNNVNLVIGNEAKKEGHNKIWLIHKPSIELGCAGGLKGMLYGLYSHGVTITECESFNPDNCDLTVWEYEDEY